MTARFLAIGECMIEMAPQDDGRYLRGFAGDTFNTAWYARKIAPPDLEVGYLSAVGDDAQSQAMAQFITGSGVVAHLARRAGMTVGLYMITLDGGERSFAYWRATSAARTLADDLDRLPGLGAGDMAYFSGITLAILPDAGRNRLLEVLRHARRAGVTIAFDPNLRPRLWTGEAEMRDWITRGAAVADIALPSFEGELRFFGDADPAATAARYAAEGTGLIVVKNGPDPILILHGTTTAHVAPDPAPAVVDTTAAGDSFNARFLVDSMAGATPEAAAAAACALSARVIGARGALVEP